MLIEKAVKKYLQWTHKEHLIPFVEGLKNLGRPSSTLFPIELLEQGLGIILSGLNNTVAIQTNLDWVWPYWVERQINPDACEFIPTGVNLITANLSRRNWTSLGVDGSSRESMLDPVGMLTLRPFGWSVFPYVRLNGENFYPSRMHSRVTQHLKEGILPCVITTYEVSPQLRWTSETMAVVAEGEELISFRHFLENLSAGQLGLTFGLALRPYNALMIGHINHIKFKKRLWRVNRRPGLLLLDKPSSIVLSDRHHGDPLARNLGDFHLTELVSRSGIECGVAEYQLVLDPGEERCIETAGTIQKLSDRPNSKFEDIDRRALVDARKNQLDLWRAHVRNGLQVELPDKILETAFYAVKNHLHVFDDGDHFSPGTFLYHDHWFRDGSYLALCFENLSLSSKVRPKIQKYLEFQESNGFFKSQTGEWDSNGQALFTIVNHIRRSGDLDLLQECYPAILLSIHWLEEKRNESKNSPSPHCGLLPAGFSAEHFGPNDHYYWDNFWNLAGVRSALWAAKRFGNYSDSKWLHAVYLDYRYHLTASINFAYAKAGRQMLPCSPYRWMDSAAVGNLVAISPLDIVPRTDSWIKNTVEYLLEHNLRDGLFFQKIIHTGLNPYLSAQLARALMTLQDDRWMDILKALCRYASPTWTWPEAIHPTTRGGCMGDGDHGWSAAEFINLIREMLVSDRNEAIHLGQGIPSEWFSCAGGVRVSGASTSGGTISYCLEPAPEGVRLSWSVQRHQQQEVLPIYFVPPAGVERTDASEGSSGRIPLVGDEGCLELRIAATENFSWHS